MTDRLNALLDSAQTTLTGIDYVEIANSAQTMLRVVFFKNTTPTVVGTVTAATITGGDRIPTVPVLPIVPADWSIAAGHPVLTLHVPEPGDFSFYTLVLVSPQLDPFYSEVKFTFKAGCPSLLDCKPLPEVCPPDDAVLPHIDYLAKDYLSFRQALLDYSAQRYPDWQERSEADLGMMFLEALCGLGDDLSYLQDRTWANGSLETATERRAIVQWARLVDYEPRPATSARTVLQFDVRSDGPIAAGMGITAVAGEGGTIPFETGTGLTDLSSYPARIAWNRGIKPYVRDDSEVCLKRGAMQMRVQGHGFGFLRGQWLLIDTEPVVSGDPPIRSLVQLAQDGVEETDALFARLFTRLTWQEDSAPTQDHDLGLNALGLNRTVLAGNIVPATQGERRQEAFAIGKNPPLAWAQVGRAAARLGPNSTPDAPRWTWLYSLKAEPLAYLVPLAAPSGASSSTLSEPAPRPEIRLTRQDIAPPQLWEWRRSLMDAGQFDPAFTIEPMRFRRVGPDTFTPNFPQDYDGDGGATIRFGGDGFGEAAEENAVYLALYRVTKGAAGNVAPDTLNKPDSTHPTTSRVVRVGNPFAALGGENEELDERVRRIAPQAFRTPQRAVRPEDYRAAAEELRWVQRAGTTFRWTGSWLTLFTTADPRGGGQTLPTRQHRELIDLLNRRRMAGYESYVLPPRYVSLDLQIWVCACPDAFAGDVRRDVLNALNAQQSDSYFHPDRFTFGTPLERSTLEARLQNVSGVCGVHKLEYRRRGFHVNYVVLPEMVMLGMQEILQIENDPDHPERGSLTVIVEGGK